VEIAKVNCENDKPLCEKHDIKGAPIIAASLIIKQFTPPVHFLSPTLDY
jgi:hypothetical protein